MSIYINEVLLDAYSQNYIQFFDYIPATVPVITHHNGRLVYLPTNRFGSSDGVSWQQYVAQSDLASASVGTAAALATPRTIAMSGDVVWNVSFDGSGNVTAAGTIQNGAVTNAKQANMANQTFKGNNSGGSAAPQDLSVITVNTMLGTVTLSGTQTLTGSKTLQSVTFTTNNVTFSTIGAVWNDGSGNARVSIGSGTHGVIELGDLVGTAGVGTVTPFIDFHYSTGSLQDYNVRLINNGDGVLTCVGTFYSSVNFWVGTTAGGWAKFSGTSSAISTFNDLVGNGWLIDGGTSADTRVLLKGGNGSPTAAISFNFSTSYDAAGTFSMQKRTTSNGFTNNIWGINLTSSKIWFGSAGGGGTLNGIINVTGECQVQTLGTVEVAKGTVTSTASVNWTSGFYQSMTLTTATNCTVSFSNPTNPCSVYLKVVAPASGTSPTITWPGTVKGSPPTTVTLAKTSMLQFFWDGSSYYYMGGALNT